ncbi:exo-alpha-sialidase [Opitutaceae bacterium TAV4]|nr:exo-alpha-sialidase [Opitutaceae bacterium TAV4]RRJ95276.1 exo-alpha-sialidase [Opitutaceae bacterium TAV4]RRJ99073.1 exo-alpha-sialidase [Opitutaceae bacterium TAV3]
MIQKFTVSRDDSIYQAWPDLALTRTGRLVCVFSECTHHGDRSYTCIQSVTSDDRGRTWSAKRAITTPLHKKDRGDPHWNCARITALRDGRLAVIVDRVAGAHEGADNGGEQTNWLWFSSDNGDTWQGPVATPVTGIVPDQIVELKHGPHAGRWTTSAHTFLGEERRLWSQRLWYSDDQGATWSGPVVVGQDAGLKLCEGSVLELPGDGGLVCFMRENSFSGLDAFRAFSHDGGATWSGLCKFALPGCHRPVAGMLQSGRVMIMHRFLQGSSGGWGWMTQNFFAALTDVESCLNPVRNAAKVRVMPLDYDRSPVADTGYSGWVQFDDGELYIVNYIIDDAHPRAQIRGYAMREEDFYLPGAQPAV